MSPKVLMRLPRWCSASLMFAEAHTDDFHAVIRKKVASLRQRVRASRNSILTMIVNRLDCPIQNKWMDSFEVVFDAGSSTMKAGFANEAFPRASFPTAVARFRHVGLIDGLPLMYCGHEAIANRGLSTMTYPVQEGLITDWAEMEKFWHHTFYKELKVAPEQARVMHAVHPLVSDKDKEKISEILFESFTVKGLYLMKAPVLALHASGRTSGIVWEGGYSCSYIAPVYEGFPLKYATILSPLNGKMLTERLQKLLAQTGYSFTTDIEKDLLNIMKEKYCYVSQDYDNEIQSGCNKTIYKLPDGQQILLENEPIICSEVLFDPSMENLNCPSVTELFSDCINKCDTDYRSLFFENIVLAGGTSMLTGIVERLQTEMTNVLRSQPLKAKIDAMPSRQYAVWTGGSILASLSSLKEFWITKEEYDDGGPERVRYKFF